MTSRGGWLSGLHRMQVEPSHTAVVEGAGVHYVDVGRGPTLLLLHGAPMWSFTWRGVIARLRDRYRCIAPDYPGCGLSDVPARPPTLRASSIAIERLVTELDLHDVTLVANDVGGPIGFGLAGRLAPRFAGFVAVDTFGFSLRGYPLVRAMIRLVTSAPFRWLNHATNFLPATTARFGIFARTLPVAERSAWLAPFADRRRRAATMALLRGIVREPEYLGEVERGLSSLADRPLLMLYGQHDAVRRAGFPRTFATFFPHHELHTIPRANHFAHEDAPELVADRIDAWHREHVQR